MRINERQCELSNKKKKKNDKMQLWKENQVTRELYISYQLNIS